MAGLTPLLSLLLLAPSNARAQAADYKSVDEAAVAFVRLVREYPDQRVEYCTFLIKGTNGRVRFGAILTGDMNRCPSGENPRKPDVLVGSVHTHPIWGGAKDLGAAGQVFSEGDFNHSEYFKVPIYLGAPAGHILRYDPGGTTCTQMSVTRDFRVIVDVPGGGVASQLVVQPGKKSYLLDPGGKPLPRPAACQ